MVIEWNPGPAVGLLFMLCVVLAGWAALWLSETSGMVPRPNRWTFVAVVVAIVVLIVCAAGLVVFAGRTSG